jgi:polysaccharide export outer membrane protein
MIKSNMFGNKRVVYSLLVFTLFTAYSCAPWGSVRAGSAHSFPTEAKLYEHRVIPGDYLDINIWEDGEMKEHKAQVSKAGTINLMFIEDIAVLGLTEKELDKHLTEVLSEYYISPIIDVKIREVVYILGEVKNPGAYTFKDGMTLAAILASAEGPTRDAKLRNVLIIRGYNESERNPKVVVANVGRMMKKGDLTQNIYLQGGDIIFLPSTVISNVNYFVKQLGPILDLVMFPGKVVFP